MVLIVKEKLVCTVAGSFEHPKLGSVWAVHIAEETTKRNLAAFYYETQEAADAASELLAAMLEASTGLDIFSF